MRNVDDLIKKAHELKGKGFTTGEIADELNISKDTALWLVTHEKTKKKMPKDIYIDWSTVGSNPQIIRHVSMGLTELIREILDENNLSKPQVIAGIAVSGVPLATLIAEEMGASLAIIRPKKHLWEPEKETRQSGFILSNFAEVQDKNVVIVDDIATSGSTLKDTIEFLDKSGANPQAAVVILDKKGLKSVANKPVKSLISVSIVESPDN